MTRGLLLVSLAAGALAAPAPASAAAATEPAIRSISVRPAEPVVGAHDSVRLVIDVVAKGARGRDGVAVKVEPGAPPGPVLTATPATAPSPAAEPPAGTARPRKGSSRSQSSHATQSATSNQWGRSTESVEGERPFEETWTAADAGPATRVAGAKSARHPAAGRPITVPPPLEWRVAPAPAARMAGGWQTWRFLPDKKLSRFYPAGTWTVTATATGEDGKTVTQYASFRLRRATRLSSVRAEQAKGGAVRLSGSLTRVDARGLTDYGPFPAERLEILWRPDTTSAWERVGEATTDDAGAFEHTITGRKGGYWRVRYPGAAHYAPDHSKSHEIAQ
jgi:hypothetical protein